MSIFGKLRTFAFITAIAAALGAASATPALADWHGRDGGGWRGGEGWRGGWHHDRDDWGWRGGWSGWHDRWHGGWPGYSWRGYDYAPYPGGVYPPGYTYAPPVVIYPSAPTYWGW